MFSKVIAIAFTLFSALTQAQTYDVTALQQTIETLTTGNCQTQYCDSGEICIVYECRDDQQNLMSCQQSIYQSIGGSVEIYDCMDGLVEIERNCTIGCEYESCSQDSDDPSQQCWEEVCSNECGFFNCTTWKQESGMWTAQECNFPGIDLTGVRLQDEAAMFQERLSSYQNTMLVIIDQLCPNNDECLKLKDAIADTLTNGVPVGFNPIDELMSALFVNGTLDNFGVQNLTNATQVQSEVESQMQSNPEFGEAIQNVTNTIGIIQQQIQNTVTSAAAAVNQAYKNFTGGNTGILQSADEILNAAQQDTANEYGNDTAATERLDKVFDIAQSNSVDEFLNKTQSAAAAAFNITTDKAPTSISETFDLVESNMNQDTEAYKIVKEVSSIWSQLGLDQLEAPDSWSWW